MMEDRDDEVFYQETERAEAERKYDAKNSSVYPLKVLDVPPPKGNIVLSGYAVRMTCQNHGKFLEDIADCDNYSDCEPQNIQQAAAILRDVVKRLSDATRDEQSGSTLTLSMCWLTQSGYVHILTAQLGISRAFLCNTNLQDPDRATLRLTREHTLLRDEERRLRTQGYGVRENNDQGEVLDSQGKLLARQIGKELHPGNSANYLTMTRSLGDKTFHERSPVFSHEPSISLASYIQEDAKRVFLFHATHGITDYVSDEEISAELLKPGCKSIELVKRIRDLACKRGSKGNMSLVMGFLERLHKPGDLIIQFVADGHGKKENVTSVAEHINHNLSFVLRDVLHEHLTSHATQSAEPAGKRLKP